MLMFICLCLYINKAVFKQPDILNSQIARTCSKNVN